MDDRSIPPGSGPSPGGTRRGRSSSPTWAAYRFYRLVPQSSARRVAVRDRTAGGAGSVGQQRADGHPTSQAATGRTGSPVTASLATFVGTPNTPVSAYTTSIDWGDGKTSKGTLAPGQLNSYSVTGSHTFAKPGWYRRGVGLQR